MSLLDILQAAGASTDNDLLTWLESSGVGGQIVKMVGDTPLDQLDLEWPEWKSWVQDWVKEWPGPPPQPTRPPQRPPPIGCFAAGTLVETPSGAVPIEGLGPGDAVLVVSVPDLTRAVGVVLATHRHAATPTLLITLDEGLPIQTTAAHPFYLRLEERFVPAQNLRPGDALAGGTITAVAPGHPAEVYNLSVDGAQTYVAGGVVVHNKEAPRPIEPPPPPPPPPGGGGGGGGLKLKPPKIPPTPPPSPGINEVLTTIPESFYEAPPPFAYEPWVPPAIKPFEAPPPFRADPYTFTPFQPPTAETFQTDPGYDFRSKEGMRAITNARSATGLLRSGMTLKELADFNQSLASQEFQNVYNREFNTWGQNVDRDYRGWASNRQAAAEDYDRLWRNTLATYAATEIDPYERALASSREQFGRAATSYGFGLDVAGGKMAGQAGAKGLQVSGTLGGEQLALSRDRLAQEIALGYKQLEASQNANLWNQLLQLYQINRPPPLPPPVSWQGSGASLNPMMGFAY